MKGEFKKRVLTGLLIGPFIASFFYLLPVRWFFLFLAIVAIFATFEFFAQAVKSDRYILPLIVLPSIIPIYNHAILNYLLYLIISPCLYFMVRIFTGYGIKDNLHSEVFRGMSTILLCEVFVILPISYLYLLKGVKPSLPVILLFTVWASDATAYLLGKAIGKRPLLPLISPKKTWEGLIGAIIGSLVIMLISSKVTGLSMGGSVFVGISIGILGQLGDIMESAGKRLYNIKDSSDLIPGHGGMLDRLDSFTLTAPFLYHYLSWVKI